MTVVFHSVAVAWEHFLLQSHSQGLPRAFRSDSNHRWDTNIQRQNKTIKMRRMSFKQKWVSQLFDEYFFSAYCIAAKNTLKACTEKQMRSPTEQMMKIYNILSQFRVSSGSQNHFMYCRSEAPDILSLDILTISRVVGGGWRQTYPLISPAFIQLSCLCVITQREVTDSMCPAAC